MENNKNNNQEPSKIQYLPIGMCIGVGVGMAIGAALGNIAVGMCTGLSIGMGIGALIDFKQNKKPNDDSENDENGKE